MDKKRFIFDMDRTLVTCSYRREADYFKSIFGERSQDFVPFIGKYLDDYENRYLFYEQEMLSLYLRDKSGLPFTPSIIQGWIESGTLEKDEISKGTFELLSYLRDHGKSLVVSTNWFGEAQKVRLKKCGLLEYFDDIYSGDQCLKPHRQAYKRAIGGYIPKECVFIGDDIYKDYIGPRLYGLDSILFDPEEKHPNTFTKVKSMNELKERY